MVHVHDLDRTALATGRSRDHRHSARSSIALALYTVALALVSAHLYRQPIYDMDSIQYMGNALLMQENDPVKIHTRVYAELDRYVPKNERDPLLGRAPAALRTRMNPVDSCPGPL